MRLAAALCVAACLFATSVAAHETVLFASTYKATVSAPLTVSLTSMATFPTPVTGPKPDRVVEAYAVTAAVRQPLILAGHEPTALRFTVTPHRRGALVAAVSLGPRDIDLTADKVAEYFAEIEPPPQTRAAYDGGALFETYTKYAKAIVCVETCGDGRQATRPLGHALEFVATPDASGGADLHSFTLLERGAPAAAVAVTVWSGDGAHLIVHTDGAGRVVVPAGARGVLMLSATRLRPPATPGARFTSDFVTLSFQRD